MKDKTVFKSTINRGICSVFHALFFGYGRNEAKERGKRVKLKCLPTVGKTKNVVTLSDFYLLIVIRIKK